MAGGDFIVNITGNVTGFDVAPINNVTTALKTLPPASQQAASSTTQMNNAFSQTAGSASTLTNALRPIQATTQQVGSSFSATGALANNYGNTLLNTSRSGQAMVGSNSALGGSFQPVQGGLSSTNTLLDQNANAMQQGEAHNTSFQGSLTGLVGGFTTLIGTGIGLFEMYHELEAAQVRAEAAHLKYEKALLAESRAQEAVDKLIKEGKTGTLDYEQAVHKLENAHTQVSITSDKWKLAQDSLNVTQAQFAEQIIPAVTSAIGGAISAFGSIRGAIPGIVSGFSSMIGLFSSGIGSIKNFVIELLGLASSQIVASNAAGEGAPKFIADAAAKTVSAGATGTLTASLRGLVGAMATVLIPLAAGAAAVAAFLAVTKAFSDNMGGIRTIFEGFGAAVGNTIPPLQGFINTLGDAGRSTMDFFARYTEALTNFMGVTHTQIDFSKKSLADLMTEWKNAGTTHSAVIDKTIEDLVNWGKAHGMTVDQIIAAERKQEASIKQMADANVGAVDQIIPGMQSLGLSFSVVSQASQATVGPMEDVVGVIARVGDAALTLSGQYVILGQGTKSTSDIMAAAFDAVDKAVDKNKQTIADWAVAHGQIVSLSGKSSTELANMASFFGKVTTSEEDNTAKAIEWLVQHKMISLVMEQGITAAVKYAEAHGALADATKKGATATEGFAKAQDDAIAKANAEAAAIQASINTGQIYAKVHADMSKAVAESSAKLAQLTQQTTNATEVQQQHTTSIQNGISAFLEWGIKVKDAATQTEIFNTGLRMMTDGFFKANPLIEQTAENMKTVGEAMLGSAEAAQKTRDLIVKAFEPLGNDMAKVVDDIAGKFEDLNKRVKKPFDDIPKYIQKAMTPEMKDFEISQARFKVLGEQLSGQFGIALATGGAQGALDFVQKVQDNLKNVGDKAALQPIIDNLQNAIANAGTPAGNQFVQAAIKALQALGPQGQQMAQELANKFGVGIDTGLKPVPGIVQKNVIDPFTGIPTTAQAVAQKVAKAFTDLGTAFDKLPGYFLGIFTQSFVTNLVGPLGRASTAINGFVNSTRVAFSNLVTSINSILAGIKMPVMPTTAPTAGTQAPIKIPAPDLSAFTAGLAKMQTDANNAFAAVVRLATIQFAGIGRAMTTAAGTTAVGLTKIQTDANNAFAAVVRLATIQFAGIGRAMTAAAGTTAVGLTKIQTDANNAFAAVVRLANLQFAGIGTALNTAVAGLAPAWAKMQLDATNAFNAIVNLANTILPPGMTAASTAMASAADPAWATLQVNATNAFNAVVNLAKTIIPQAVAGWNTLVTAINTPIAAIQRNSTNAWTAVVNSAKAVIPGGVAAWYTLSNSILTPLGAIQRNAVNAWNAVVNAANSTLPRVVGMFNNIASSVNNATSAVNSLISRINSIPTSRKVDVTIVEHVVQQVTRVPAAAAAGARPAGAAAVPVTILPGGAGGAAKTVRVEVKEPIIVKLNDREFIRLINRRILELDIGALA